jgi:2-C-methyl-D-erythritol 4-phosphate cytidylyltransferase
MDPSVWTIVLAAGRGARFGGEVPKQYQPLGDRRVLDWSLESARAVSAGVVLVVDPDRADQPEPAADAVVAGGLERADSVRAGLTVVPGDVEVIVVHDAARPLASPALFERVVQRILDGVDAVIPAVTVTDTIKRVRGDQVVETLDREALRAAQTPQAFRAGVLRDAHRELHRATDDAALVEAAGGVVVVEPGETTNIKVTEAHDLAVAELLLG